MQIGVDARPSVEPFRPARSGGWRSPRFRRRRGRQPAPGPRRHDRCRTALRSADLAEPGHPQPGHLPVAGRGVRAPPVLPVGDRQAALPRHPEGEVPAAAGEPAPVRDRADRAGGRRSRPREHPRAPAQPRTCRGHHQEPDRRDGHGPDHRRARDDRDDDLHDAHPAAQNGSVGPACRRPRPGAQARRRGAVSTDRWILQDGRPLIVERDHVRYATRAHSHQHSDMSAVRTEADGAALTWARDGSDASYRLLRARPA